MDDQQPPKTGWAPLAPELLVTDFAQSLVFWRDVLGFSVAYGRLAEKFAYLERPEGAQVMLCERNGKWETAPLEAPFGRGVMLQIYVADVDALHRHIDSRGITLYAGPREVWRQWGDREGGQKEIFVQDPDGYLLMLAQHIGERDIKAGAD